MKKEVLVKNVTRNIERLMAEINDSVRTMNLMIDQLYDQQVKMEELMEEKEKYPRERARREEAIQDSKEKYEEELKVVADLEKELASLKFYDIKGRFETRQTLKEHRESVARRRESLLRATYVLNTKNDRYSQIDENMEKVLIPNFRRHLAKFYGALRAYREKAKTFEALSGVEIPKIDETKIILFGEKHELPTIDIDQEIPKLVLEVVDEDYFE